MQKRKVSICPNSRLKSHESHAQRLPIFKKVRLVRSRHQIPGFEFFWLSLARSPTADESSSFLIHIFGTYLHVSRHMRMINISRLSWKTLLLVTGCHFIACQRPRCRGSYEAAFVSLVYIFNEKWKILIIKGHFIGMGMAMIKLISQGLYWRAVKSVYHHMLSECTTHYVPVFIILNVWTG